jgi:hypothetical protein
MPKLGMKLNPENTTGAPEDPAPPFVYGLRLWLSPQRGFHGVADLCGIFHHSHTS